MDCNNCNEELKQGAKFCGGCGTKVEPTVEETVVPTVEETVAPVVEETVAPAQESPSFSVDDILTEERKEAARVMAKEAGDAAKEVGEAAKVAAKDVAKTMKKLSPKSLAIVGGGIFSVLVILVLICTLIFSKETLNLEDYVYAEFTGYEGVGNIELEFDYLAFTEDVVRHSKDAYSEDSVYIYYVVDSIEFDYDEEDVANLKNGDKVEVELEYDEERAKKLDVNIKSSDMKFTAQGLEEVVEFDPFDYITIEYSGIAPNATAKVVYDVQGNEKMSTVSAGLSKQTNISQGDEITITITNADPQDTLRHGYVVTETTKKVVCSAVNSYVAKIDDINKEYVEKFTELASDEMEAYFVNNDLKYADLKYEGMYVLIVKEGQWDVNMVYPVLSATISTEEIEATKLYFPVEIRNVVLNTEGEYEYNTPVKLPAAHSGISMGWYSQVVGYTDVDQMYEKIIVANKNNYNWDATKALIGK